MKCYVTMDTQGRCVITRIDSKNSRWHQKTISRNEFLNFWYKKVRIERLTRWFQFMAEDSFCAEWLEINERTMAVKTRECIFILDDSVCNNGMRDYLVTEVAGYFHENQQSLQNRCTLLENFLSYIRQNEESFLECIREFDNARDLSCISERLDMNFFIAGLKLYRNKWVRSKALFAGNSIYYNLKKALHKVIGVVAVFAGLDVLTGTSLGIALVTVGLTCFLSLGARMLVKARFNQLLIGDLCQMIGKDKMESVDFETVYEPQIDAKKKNSLLDLIKIDTDYIKNHSGVGFREDIGALSILAKDYAVDAQKALHEDVLIYMDRLLTLEESLYGKVVGCGLREEPCLLDVENLETRLSVLGYSKSVYGEDSIYMQVIDTLGVLLESPFYGCELEVVLLYRIAIRRVRDIYTSKGSLMDNYERELTNELQVIASKLEMAQKYDALQGALRDLNASTGDALPAIELGKGRISFEKIGE